MKRTLITLLSVCFALSAPAQEQPENNSSPEAYYEAVQTVISTLYSLGRKWGAEFSYISGYDKHFSRLAELMRYPEEFAGKKRMVFQQNGGIGKGGKKLNEMVLAFLDFEQATVKKSLVATEQLNDSSSPAQLEAVRLLLAEQEKAEAPYIQKIVAAHNAYGDQNGIEIMPVPSE